MKRKILIIMGRYLPGYKDGGPVRSVKNLTDFLGDEYDFKILTCDRDHGDTEPYLNIKVNGWNCVGKADVYYVPPKGFTMSVIKKLVAEVDLIYVCGCFNDYAINTLLLNRLGQIKKPVVVAAMGLFSPMEFRLKYKKKKIFIMVFNVTGMFKNIFWSATSELEISEIKQQVKSRDGQFFIAEDLPRMVDPTPIYKKKGDTLEVVWISRIAPKKNLKGAIQILQRVKSKVHFTIYGPIHVEEYWHECQEELKKLPLNVLWEYKGNVESEQVVETLKPYHVFLFPTLGENYGHVIQEALSAGCACILSDQTPWKGLEESGVGYVFSVEETNDFANAVEMYSKMSQMEINAVADRALRYAIQNSNKKARKRYYWIHKMCIGGGWKMILLADSNKCLTGSHHAVYRDTMAELNDTVVSYQTAELIPLSKDPIRGYIARKDYFGSLNSSDILCLLHFDEMVMTPLLVKKLRKKHQHVIGVLHWFPNSKVKEIMLKSTSKYVDALVVHSEYILNQALERNINNVVTIDYPAFGGEKYSYLRKGEINDKKTTFLCLGSTRRDKGLDILADSFEYIDDSIKDKILFLLAGKESNIKYSYVQEKANKYRINITIINRFLEDDLYWKCIYNSDVIVLPYRKLFTGNSGPMTDGVYAGKYILGPGSGNIGFLITKYHLGDTFEAESPTSLANSIFSVATSPKEIDRNTYKEKISVNAFKNSYDKLFKEVGSGYVRF